MIFALLTIGLCKRNARFDKPDEYSRVSVATVDMTSCNLGILMGNTTVKTTTYFKGALVSQQTNYLCHTSKDYQEDLLQTTHKPLKSSCSSTKPDILHLNVYIPKNVANVKINEHEKFSKMKHMFNDIVNICTPSGFEKFDVAGRSGPQQFDILAANNLFSSLVTAIQTLPKPFTIIESGHLCGASTCYIASIKKFLCPECPFISIDPGYLGKELGADENCVLKNLQSVNLDSQVKIIKDVGQELKLHGPVGYIFNDDGKYRKIVSVQHSLWNAYLMEGGFQAYHDYYYHTENNDAIEATPNHRTHVHDLINTGEYEIFHKPKWGVNTWDKKFLSIFDYDTYLQNKKVFPLSWKFDIAVIQKKKVNPDWSMLVEI